MTTGDVFLIGAVVGILTFVRDWINNSRSKKRRLTIEERESLRDPIEIRGLILDGAKDAVALQASLLLDLRTQMKALQDEGLLKDQKIRDLQVQASTWESERSKLYGTIGLLRTRIDEMESRHGR